MKKNKIKNTAIGSFDDVVFQNTESNQSHGTCKERFQVELFIDVKQSVIQLCWFAPLACNILSEVYGGSCLSERKTKSASLSLLLSILTTDKTHLLQGIEIEGPVLFWQFFQESHQSELLLCWTKRPFLYWIQWRLLKIDKIQTLNLWYTERST